jgi:hypothetical protein
MLGEWVVWPERDRDELLKLTVFFTVGRGFQFRSQTLIRMSAMPCVFELHYRTLLSLTGPPSEVMPLSMFLTMHGCSTTEMARDGMGNHGACRCSSLVVSSRS